MRAYERVVAKLGEAIATAGANHPLTELRSLPAWGGLKNAFAKPPTGASRGLKHALFVFVAASHSEVPANLAERYGDESKEWKPFHPSSGEEVGFTAMDVSTKKRIYYKDLPLDAQLISRVKEAAARKISSDHRGSADPARKEIKESPYVIRRYTAGAGGWTTAGLSGLQRSRLGPILSTVSRRPADGVITSRTVAVGRDPDELGSRTVQ